MSRRHHHEHHRRQFHGLGLYQDGNNAQAQAEQQDVKRQVATLVSVVYKTATPTFDGPVGGYTTIIPSIQAPTVQSTSTLVHTLQSVNSITQQQQSSLAASTTIAQPSISAADSASIVAASLSSLLVSSPVNPVTTSSSIAALVSTPSSSSLLTSIQTTSLTLVSASPTLNTLSTSTDAVVSSASQASSSEPTIISNHELKGLTGGAKAGIAIGVILGLVAIIGLLAFCCLRRKKQQREAHERSEDEKNPFDDNAATLAPSHASTRPQVGLRPLTQYRPEMAAQVKYNNTLLSGKVLTTTSPQHAEKSPMDPPNPFEQVDASESTPTEDLSMPSRQEIPAPLRIRTPSPEAVVDAGLLTGASAKLAQRHNAPKPLNIKRVPSPIPAAPSPSGTEFSMTSTSQGSMVNTGPSNNVHRIQLDFKPSMEDELELRAGQLIRLLHEYDDGWVSVCFLRQESLLTNFQALCIRLDRSQQGVAPRSCLSTRPVKPRIKKSPLHPSSSEIRGPQHECPPPSKLGSSSMSQHGQGSESPTPAPRAKKSAATINSRGPQPEDNNELRDSQETKGLSRSVTMNHSVEATGLGVQGTEQESQLATSPISQPPSPPRTMQRKPVPGQTT